MASDTQICNFALSHLGKSGIASLNEASAEARLCKQFFPQARDTLLAANAWTFANKTTELAQIANTKPTRWAFAYQVPEDCLKIRRVVDVRFSDQPEASSVDVATGPYDYAVEGETIFAPISPCNLEYTAASVTSGAFPPLFVEALALALAAALAMPLTRDLKNRDYYSKAAASAYTTAVTADTDQVRNVSDIQSEFQGARI